MAIVARLLRGEPLELVARETNVSIARLSEWRERALAGAATALKERERDDRDDEIARLKSKVGEITMDNELLYAKIAALEGNRPWPTGGRDDEPTLSPCLARCYGLARSCRSTATAGGSNYHGEERAPRRSEEVKTRRNKSY